MDNAREKTSQLVIFGSIGAAVGGAVGGYVASASGHLYYAAAGGLLGAIIGAAVSHLFGNQVGDRAVALKTRLDVILGIASFLLAVGGVAAFFITREKTLILSTVFFAMCGAYLLKR